MRREDDRRPRRRRGAEARRGSVSKVGVCQPVTNLPGDKHLLIEKSDLLVSCLCFF